MDRQLWNECVEFHGHECGGIALGFQVATYAKEMLGEVAKVKSYTSKCPADAMRMVLKCTEENGKLKIEDCDKMIFEFEGKEKNNRNKVRIIAKEKPKNAPKGKDYWLNTSKEDLFDVEYME